MSNTQFFKKLNKLFTVAYVSTHFKYSKLLIPISFYFTNYDSVRGSGTGSKQNDSSAQT